MRPFLLAILLCVSCGGGSDGAVISQAIAQTSQGPIAFHAERRGAFSNPIPLERYDPTRNLWGTRLWTNITFTTGDGQYLLQTSGRVIIRHAYKFLPNGSNEYAIYANCRVALISAPTIDQLPPVGPPPPESTVLFLDGGNIGNPAQHYFVSHLETQVVLAPNTAYRPELWCASGTDAIDIDGVGEMNPYNAGNTHQYNVIVWKL